MVRYIIIITQKKFLPLHAMFADLASRCIRIESSELPSVVDCVKELQLLIIYANSKGGLGETIPTLRRL